MQDFNLSGRDLYSSFSEEELDKALQSILTGFPNCDYRRALEQLKSGGQWILIMVKVNELNSLRCHLSDHGFVSIVVLMVFCSYNKNNNDLILNNCNFVTVDLPTFSYS